AYETSGVGLLNLQPGPAVHLHADGSVPRVQGDVDSCEPEAGDALCFRRELEDLVPGRDGLPEESHVRIRMVRLGLAPPHAMDDRPRGQADARGDRSEMEVRLATGRPRRDPH